MNDKVLLFSILVLALTASQATTQSDSTTSSDTSPTNVPSAPSKYFPQLELQELSAITSKHRFVLVLFNSGEKEHAKLSKILSQLQKSFAKKDIAVAQVQLTVSNRSQLEQLGIHIIPSFYIYVEGYRKHYTGELRFQNIKIWVREVMTAKPLSKLRVADIENIDRHYFVYAAPKLLAKNKRKFQVLAKLISPLSVYTGLAKPELDKLLKNQQPSSAVWIFREYRNEIIPLDLEQGLEELAQFVTSNEFPQYMECDKSALRFIRDFKIPVLAYFASSGSDKNWEFIKTSAKDYKEYLITVLVKPANKNRCATFLKRFLDVQSTPSLRILSLAGKIKRHLFLGVLDAQHTNFFLTNYVNGNLKSYSLNQKLAAKQQLEGIKVANYKLFKQALGDYNRVYLFYIYDGDVKALKRHLAILGQVQEKLAANKTFSVYVIDHDRNDLDGFYNNSLPLVFLIAKKGKMVHYDEKKITANGLLGFVKEHLPYLKVDDPLNKETDL